MDILNHYFTAVAKALHAVSNGCDAREELRLLEPLQSELRLAFDNLFLRPDPIAAAAKYSAVAERRREQQVFQLSWRGGGDTELVTGWSALAKEVKLSVASLRVYLSRGKGAFSLLRQNTLTGEPDQLQVVRLTPEQDKQPKRGRPRKGTRDVAYM